MSQDEADTTKGDPETLDLQSAGLPAPEARELGPSRIVRKLAGAGFEVFVGGGRLGVARHESTEEQAEQSCGSEHGRQGAALVEMAVPGHRDPARPIQGDERTRERRLTRPVP